MIETSESLTNLTGALLKIQGAIDGVHKNKQNPHFKSSYATLENVIDTARPALQEAGIAFVQAPGLVVDGSVEVTTMLVHSSGEWMRSTLHVPLGKKDPQGVGSAITYGCRYSLMAMLGLPPTDDDAEAAMDRGAANTQTPRPTTPRASSAQLKRENIWPEFQADLRDCGSTVALQKLAMEWSQKAEKDGWPETWKSAAHDEINAHRKQLLAKVG